MHGPKWPFLLILIEYGPVWSLLIVGTGFVP